MSWEVRTMQSKTSYFNATLFRKNLTRFWPLWGLASFIGALFPLAVLLDMVHRGWNVLSAPDFTGMYYDAVSAVPVINLVYAALCAMAVWSYLYNARSVGLMHTLFTLEDRYGLTVETGENGVSLRVDPRKGRDAAELSEMLTAWAEQAEKYRSGEINREDYDKWRYNYPKYDETSGYVKVPSQQLSDVMLEAFKDRLKDDK